ncbi:MAG: metal-dependent transcriptional regulator, partial [Candidatus Geothermarchaeales archaeon]
LEALWISQEEGTTLAKISWVARYLGISSPSTVEMLKKLEESGYVTYTPRKGVRLSRKGRAAARRIIRNHRLVEVLMKKALSVEIDEEAVCGMEHHMDEDFANALCTSLGHPRRCPHGNPIPRGECCG